MKGAHTGILMCIYLSACGTTFRPEASSQASSTISSYQSEVEEFLCKRTKNSMDAHMVVSGLDHIKGDISKEIRSILKNNMLKDCWPFAYVALGVYGNAQDIPYLISKSENSLEYLPHGGYRESLKEKNYILHKNRHYVLRSIAWLTRFTDESDNEFNLAFDLLKACSEPGWWGSSNRSWRSELSDEIESTSCLDFIAMMESEKSEEFLLSIRPRDDKHKEQIKARILVNQNVRSKGIMESILPGTVLRRRQANQTN